MKTLDPREYDVFSFKEELYDRFVPKKRNYMIDFFLQKKKDGLAYSKLKEIQSNVIIMK